MYAEAFAHPGLGKLLAMLLVALVSIDEQYVAYKHDRAMVQSIRAMVMEHPGCHMMYSASNVYILVGIPDSDNGVVF